MISCLYKTILLKNIQTFFWVEHSGVVVSTVALQVPPPCVLCGVWMFSPCLHPFRVLYVFPSPKNAVIYYHFNE